MKGGFAESPLRMNRGLGQLEQWTENAIQQRADSLAQHAVKVWSSPHLDSSLLDAYRPVPAATGSYTISDHPYLKGALGVLFDAFRKETLALDPTVTEEFLKLYVAYKAETNFVDVVPQARRLRLSLNIKFPEVTDPKSICRDVTNLGRWGNGDVEVSLASIDELPYVIGLVRQSFERQMGDGTGV